MPHPTVLLSDAAVCIGLISCAVCGGCYEKTLPSKSEIPGSSEISGAAVIQFYEAYDGCRGVYTKTAGAPVDPSCETFFDYYNDLQKYGADVYFNCFRYQFG